MSPLGGYPRQATEMMLQNRTDILHSLGSTNRSQTGEKEFKKKGKQTPGLAKGNEGAIPSAFPVLVLAVEGTGLRVVLLLTAHQEQILGAARDSFEVPVQDVQERVLDVLLGRLLALLPRWRCPVGAEAGNISMLRLRKKHALTGSKGNCRKTQDRMTLHLPTGVMAESCPYFVSRTGLLGGALGKTRFGSTPDKTHWPDTNKWTKKRKLTRKRHWHWYLTRQSCDTSSCPAPQPGQR